MLSAYAFGLVLIIWPIYNFTPPENTASDFVLLQFIVSVAISGSISPQLYIHLVELQKEQEFVPSRSLLSLRFASSVGPEVSCLFAYYL